MSELYPHCMANNPICDIINPTVEYGRKCIW